jgi:hypothetical protein
MKHAKMLAAPILFYIARHGPVFDSFALVNYSCIFTILSPPEMGPKLFISSFFSL